ncbi:TetR/AcrR family transcriptional regulator [Actinokineospora iranica]|uniref:DNA-binding transcriptional regulator, AcrR family n=1 Tax=Actinokineospora iranica TaxID=1271860 RepID=A0A1G6VDL0_9PSEU|nr:TetR/AcrR family transcriptional regulator [Actinokineospora iranica]SDD50935.1 DNA-binding transcriptional regulator, AcrR family [Actinokineospora iranica]
MTKASAPRVRRTAQDRRKQLIGIGLRMLTARPIHQITVDEVAAEAGISRSLLFHYFPTKQDYYIEVVRAAARRLLRAADTDTDGVRGIVTGYVEFIQRRHTQYVSLFRAAGQDDWVRRVHDETQNAITERVLSALGQPGGSEPVELAIRAWLAFTEELTIEWTGRGRTDQETLIRLLLSTLDHVVAAAS